MKLYSKILLLCALISGIGLVPQLRAATGCSSTVVWEGSSSPDVAGYAVYYGVSGGLDTNRYDAGLSLSVTITGLLPATTYFFYVVVYDAYGDESPPSNVLLYTTPPISPLQLSPSANGTMNIQFQVTPGTACAVQYTPSLNPPTWTWLTTAVADTNGMVSIDDLVDPSQPSRFYRGVISSQLAPQTAHRSPTKPSLSTSIQWDASASPDTVGYMVYYGAVGSVTNQLDVGSALSATINGLIPATRYFFYVVSYNSSGDQSPPSNLAFSTTSAISPLQMSPLGNGTVLLQFTVSPGAPCHVEYTTDLNSPAWTLLSNAVADTNGLVQITDTIGAGNRFYRGSVP